MNKVILSGRLTADPEIRYSSQTGKPVATYTLAVDRGKDEADFIRCVAWENRAEFAGKWLKKGMKILIDGSIRTGSYTNREGQKVYTTDIWVNAQEFAGARSDGQENAAPPAAHPDDGAHPGFVNIPDGVDDDGLPFN